MSKYSFRPTSVDFLPNIPLLLAITGVSVFSTATLGVSHGFVDRVACSCLAALMSNLWYVVLTGMQCLRFRLECLCKQTSSRTKSAQDDKKRGAVVDDRRDVENTDDVAQITGQYSMRTLLCHTVEFRHAPREVRLFVSRKELWYILYPTAFAVFVLFYCIPIYDVSCTVSLIMGLLSKSCYDEIKRGIYWKRSTGRKICFILVTLCGVICASGLLLISTVVSRHSPTQEQHYTGRNATSAAGTNTTGSSGVVVGDDNMLGTLLHGDGLEDAFRRDDVHAKRSSQPTETVEDLEMPADDIETNVREAINSAYSASMQNPNLVQMMFVWGACSYIPFFLGHTPDSVRLPVLLEIIQPSVSCIAALVLFLACATSQHSWVPGPLLQSPSFVAYICLVPIGVWCAVFFIIRASRRKTTTHVCCMLMVAAYLKLVHVMRAHPERGRRLGELSVFVGFVCAFYTVFTVIFIRMENKCIQMGWDSSQDEDDDTDDEYNDMVIRNQARSRQEGHYGEHDILPRYCIEDVLQRVTDDIKTTEYILSHPTGKVTSSNQPQPTEPAAPPSAAHGMSPKSSVSSNPRNSQTQMLSAIEEDPHTSVEDHDDSVEEDTVKHALLPISPEQPHHTKKIEKRAVIPVRAVRTTQSNAPTEHLETSQD